jgi:hypothetical protein
LCITAGLRREKPLALQQRQAAETCQSQLSPRKQWTFPGLPVRLVDNFVNKEPRTGNNSTTGLFFPSEAPRERKKKTIKINDLKNHSYHCTFPQAILLPIRNL